MSTETTVVPVPVVRRTGDSADFFDMAASGRLLLRRCVRCSTARGPQEQVCPRCFATEHRAEAAAGPATLVSWAVVHRSPVPVVAAPYVAGIVEVEEGPWVLARVLTVPGEPMRVGLPLRIAVAPAADGGEAVVLARTEAASPAGLLVASPAGLLVASPAGPVVASPAGRIDEGTEIA
ncbi:Zn-ribbon domain-containing OB-fold protein [Tsukamurella soli]|uniref:DUF35 domain-containing protein n=1 Tax=Tsukamurella soli TaxID=644556 RepID=A0ABP8JMQ4_9ACTN